MLLEVKNACFSYRPGKAPDLLRDINLSVNKGEVLTILGSNGAGKTSLLKNVLGLLPWTSGLTLLDGKDIKAWHERELWQKISYVPQAKALTFSYSVADMVLLGRNAHLRLFEQPGEHDRKLVDKALEMIGISHLKYRQCNEISGGELQMVLIARALCAEPEILVLDEPESNLDFRNQLIVIDTIEKLSKELGITSIVNTHYPAHALRISDKTLLLGREGEYFFGPTREVMEEHKLARIFQVDVRICALEIDGRKQEAIIPLALH